MPKFESMEEAKHEPSTPLYYAALYNLVHHQIIPAEQILSTLNNIGGLYGTALQACCVKGHRESFQALISWGADVNVAGGKFATPLIAAARFGRRIMVFQLLDQGADLTATFPSRLEPTALYASVVNNELDIARKLVERGAGPIVSVLNVNGWSALNAAAQRGGMDVMQLLLSIGADSSVPNKDKSTPFHNAAAMGHLKICKALLKVSDKDPKESRGCKGVTPLAVAARNGHLNVAAFLLDHGADANALGDSYETPLHLAIEQGHPEIVHLLLKKGADVSARRASGYNSLSLAA